MLVVSDSKSLVMRLCDGGSFQWDYNGGASRDGSRFLAGHELPVHVNAWGQSGLPDGLSVWGGGFDKVCYCSFSPPLEQCGWAAALN